MQKYKIVRFYEPHKDKRNRIIRTGLTLEQAQAHCNNPETKKAGVYFDGYIKEYSEPTGDSQSIRTE